jgi:hypothetical protein
VTIDLTFGLENEPVLSEIAFKLEVENSASLKTQEVSNIASRILGEIRSGASHKQSLGDGYFKSISYQQIAPSEATTLLNRALSEKEYIHTDNNSSLILRVDTAALLRFLQVLVNNQLLTPPEAMAYELEFSPMNLV